MANAETVLDWIAEGFRALVQLDGPPNVEERRRSLRVRCSYSVLLVSGERELKGEVTDAGLAGLHVRLGEPIKTGRLCIVWKEGQDQGMGAPCRVVWTRFSKKDDAMTAGLQFEGDPLLFEGSWVAALFSRLGFDDRVLFQRRQHLRAKADIPAAVCHDERILPATVLNLGVGGAFLECPCEATAGEEVELVLGPEFGLRKLHVQARILRSQGAAQREVSVEFCLLNKISVRQLGRYIHNALSTWD